jgi:hypothetical protein
MLDWFTDTGFGYLLGMALVTLVGLLLVYRGLWGDHSKGRVRCPKCWYDMRGSLPRMTCPECGHDAGQEGRLHNTRRRWGRAVVGILLVLLSAYPLHIVGGWWREQAVLRGYGIAALQVLDPIGPCDWEGPTLSGSSSDSQLNLAVSSSESIRWR